MAVRWYLAYSLSYCEIEELLLERGLRVDHATVNRWVIEYSPQLASSFKTKKKPVKVSWRMDEIYVKVKGQWMYQYRAVDKFGDTVDCYFAKNRDKKAVLAFFKKAIGSAGKPSVVNIDKNGYNTAALVEINKTLIETEQIKIRQNKYLNNVIEQDHRFVKKLQGQCLVLKQCIRQEKH